MIVDTSRTTFLTLLALVGLALAACGGTLPADLPANVELEVEDGVEEVEFSGAVETAGTSEWVIDGLAVLISADTEIKGNIAVGDIVKVHARLTEDGQLQASEIEPAEADDGDDDLTPEPSEEPELDEVEDEIEFTGLVGSMAGDSWTVAGRALTVPAGTEIKDEIGVGDVVKVHAFEDDIGILTAREIELAEEDDLKEQDEGEGEAEDDLDEDDDDQEIEFEGVIESRDGDSWVIGGITVVVTGNTELEGDLQVGTFVEVEATEDESGDLIALEIEAEEDDAEEGDDDLEEEEDDHHDEDEHDEDEADDEDIEEDEDDEDDD